jgi:hypothetical protein
MSSYKKSVMEDDRFTSNVCVDEWLNTLLNIVSCGGDYRFLEF